MHSETCVLDRGFHCGSCHTTLGTLTLFDGHRWGHVNNIQCSRPEEGPEGIWHIMWPVKDQEGRPKVKILEIVQDRHGVWQTLEGFANNLRVAARLAEGRRKS